MNQSGYNSRSWRLLLAAGFAMLPLYAVAWKLGDLRANTIAFLWVYAGLFLLYAIATWLALCIQDLPRPAWPTIFALAALMGATLLFTSPTLSDDMYRYVWDGRVQAAGYSPYTYPPSASQLAHLRDDDIWPQINRKNAVTVYPPLAEAIYVILWRILPDNVRWFQLAMFAGSLITGLLLSG
jgi:alpha-1,6-mannosyltransferase